MITFRLGLLPLEPIKDELRHNLINQEVGMTEVLVTPKSFLVGRKIRMGNYFYGGFMFFVWAYFWTYINARKNTIERKGHAPVNSEI